MSGGGAKAGRRLVISGASKKAKKIERFSFLRSFFFDRKESQIPLKKHWQEEFCRMRGL